MLMQRILSLQLTQTRKEEPKYVSFLLDNEKLPEKMRSFPTCSVIIFHRSADMNIDN